MNNRIPSQITARFVALPIHDTGWVDSECEYFSPIIADDNGIDFDREIEDTVSNCETVPSYIGIFKLVGIREVITQPVFNTLYVEDMSTPHTPAFNDSRLTPRMNEVVNLARKNFSRKEIALELGIKPSTVGWYYTQIFNRTRLVLN